VKYLLDTNHVSVLQQQAGPAWSLKIGQSRVAAQEICTTYGQLNPKAQHWRQAASGTKN
jgi:hypothetical protein